MNRRIMVYDSNYIRAFGFSGPVTTPVSLNDDTVRQLLNEGHSVYEKLADGSSRRLTKADFEMAIPEPKSPVKVATKIQSVATPATTETTTVVEEETSILEEAKVFNGVSATTAPVIPEKTEETPDTTATTKSQRRAQRKARIAAAEAQEKSESENDK